MVTIAGVTNASFNGTFDIASVVPGSPDPQISTQFTVVQAGPDATSGGGTATTQSIGGAITGGCFYDSTAFPAAYQGNYFFGDYNSGRMMRVILDAMNQPSRVEEFANNPRESCGHDYWTGRRTLLCRSVESWNDQALCLHWDHATAEYYCPADSFQCSRRWLVDFFGAIEICSGRRCTVTTSRFNGDTDLTVSSGASLVFTPANFSVPQLVTIAAAADADTVNDSAVFRVTAPTIATYDLTVNGIDTPPPPLSVISRKIHGAAGTFDINLPLTGSPGVECRSDGATGDYQLVITFATTVTVNGTVQARVTSGVGDVGTGGVPNGGVGQCQRRGRDCSLTNVANVQTIGITLFDVHQGAHAADMAVQMSVLVGDTTRNRIVNSADIGETKAAAELWSASRNDVRSTA